jgi:hypothetical protein
MRVEMTITDPDLGRTLPPEEVEWRKAQVQRVADDFDQELLEDLLKNPLAVKRP